MKSKEAIERHIKELLSEMTVEEKLDTAITMTELL